MLRSRKIVAGFGLVVAQLFLLAPSALAQPGPSLLGGAASNAFDVEIWRSMAAAVVLSVAVAFGALGQGKAAAAGLEGISRNPAAGGRLFNSMILALALIESLVIYALIMAFALKP